MFRLISLNIDTILSKSLTNDKLMKLDLDSFLATMTVPPPTSSSIITCELTSKQISSFITPPPPSRGANNVIVINSISKFG